MFRVLQRHSKQVLVVASLLLAGFGCSNLPFVPINKAPSRIFLTDFSTAWTAALEAVSAGRDVIRVNNREAGTIETNWINNTESRNFLDVFSNEDFFLQMRFKLQVQVREGKKNGQQAVMVRVLKQQQKQNTFLGGWQDVESDGLEESVYLYRIGRLVAIQQANEDQQEKQKEIDDGDTLF
ncbi:MAG: hypothetical protein ACXWQO_16950 [Bdellovibrionota bacterium]